MEAVLFLLSAAMQTASSTPANLSPVLWGGLRVGMPKSEVKALYPDYKSNLSDQCGVRLLSVYRNGGLRGVSLVNRGKRHNCAEFILNDYTLKYGQPQKGRHTQIAIIPFIRPISGERYHWVSGNRDITLITFAPDTYNLIFRAAGDPAED